MNDREYEEHEVQAARGTLAILDRLRDSSGTCLLIPHRPGPDDPVNYQFLQRVGTAFEGFGLKPQFMVGSELGVHSFWFWKDAPTDSRHLEKMVEAGLISRLRSHASVFRPIKVSNGRDLMKNLATGSPPFVAFNEENTMKPEGGALH